MSTVGTPKTPEQIQHEWSTDPRWQGIERTWTADDVVRLERRGRGGAHAGARRGAERLGPRSDDAGLRPRYGAWALQLQPGRPDGARRPEGDLPVGFAGRR